ncbi:hypothetical protein [Rugosimonospora africana]|uniref:Uncharacterized protein n=1 Tax=Rugosimonospora africana TaxID=556532 RepID=A0A8J3VXA8_9ACTN|nr:hypothetical protein [Rugosimonospora africana]GIH21671.1 hypothetical protein Raf01_98430 [Rugosimonospora africana]
MRPHRPRHWLGAAAGLAAVVTLLALPTPHRPTGGTTVSGPATLATVWPATRPFALHTTLAAGSTYTPTLIVDPRTDVGTATSADGTQTSLVVNNGGTSRVLQTRTLGDGGLYDAITVAGTRLFWIQSARSATGLVKPSLWSAPTSGGSPTMMSTDVGQPLFTGSRYDLEPVDDRLYWISADGDRTDVTQLRSVALTGGPVSTRMLTGAWRLTAWPWLVTAPSAPNTPPRLLNVHTGAVTPIRVPANKLVTCDQTWCRLIPDDQTRRDGTDLVHADGTDRQHVAGKNSNPIANDPALLGRFEPMLTPVSRTLAGTSLFRLSLYDTRRRALVQVASAVSKAGAQGDYVWWATGDNETLAWHALDLRTLR